MTPEMMSEIRAREERKQFTVHSAMNVLDSILRFELNRCADEGMKQYPDPELLAKTSFDMAEAMAVERANRNLNPQV